MIRKGKRSSEPSLRPVLAWAAITFAMAGAAGGTGYFVAAAAGEASADPPRASSVPPAAKPVLLRVSDIYASGRRAGVRAARRRALAEGRRQGRMRGRVEAGERFRPGEPAYRRIFAVGRRAGAREALGGFAFAGDGFYLVDVTQRGRRVGLGYGPLQPGDTYQLCGGGTRACLRQER